MTSPRALPSILRLRPILPPAGHFRADPHAVTAEDATHIFFEDFHYGDNKGRISVLTLGPDGQPGAR